MFAIIETKGATHLVINIPVSGAEKSLPALASMLENNATFISKSWREVNIIKPEMTITLGSQYLIENDGVEFLIAAPEHSDVLSNDFEIVTPDVFLSNKKLREEFAVRVKKLEADLQFQKDLNSRQQDAIDNLNNVIANATSS